MKHTHEAARWGLFQWVVTAANDAFLGVWALLPALLSAFRGDINSSVVAKNELEIRSTLLALKEQQVLSNLKLDAIKAELQALNEKAAGVSGLPKASSQ
jgi:hypothetical protein